MEQNVGKWQPISEAPMDGTVVLLWWDGDFAPLAHWDGCQWVYKMAQAWPDGMADIIARRLLGYEPTHWMPLPEPPEET